MTLFLFDENVARENFQKTSQSKLENCKSASKQRHIMAICIVHLMVMRVC